jgi:hypothetical protein
MPPDHPEPSRMAAGNCGFSSIFLKMKDICLSLNASGGKWDIPNASTSAIAAQPSSPLYNGRTINV